MRRPGRLRRSDGAGGGGTAVAVIAAVAVVAAVTVVAWWLFASIVDVDLPNLAWVAGLTLVAVGVAGLWTTLRPSRQDR